MQDDRFEQEKREHVERNERLYGQTVRKRFGNAVMDEANASLMRMTRGQRRGWALLGERMSDALRFACMEGNPKGDLAQAAVRAHREWLDQYWETVTPQTHRALTRMYAEDQRFREYYDRIAPGCAVLLRDAVEWFYRLAEAVAEKLPSAADGALEPGDA